MQIIYKCKKCKSECTQISLPTYPPVHQIICPTCGVIWDKKEEIKTIEI